MARISKNIIPADNSEVGALSREVPKKLLEAYDIPPVSNAPPKRKAKEEPDSGNKKQKKKNGTKPAPPEHVYQERNEDSPTEEATLSSVSSSPVASAGSSTSIAKKSSASLKLTPTITAEEWQVVWDRIIAALPSNPRTKKPAAWPVLMTRMLVYMFGSGNGIATVMEMAHAVYDNFGLMTTAALARVSTTSCPSIKALEQRYRRVFALSQAPALQTAECLCEYYEMAGDFYRLEGETRNPSTELGKKWMARSGDDDSHQARSSLIMHEVLNSWHPGPMNQEHRDREMAKLRKLREFARNIAMMIEIFGWGVVPLLACAPWKQV
jgi:hypothetical protein